MKLNQKGQITAIIAFVIIAGIMVFGIRLLSKSQKGQKGAQDSDDGYSVMTKKLEALTNAPWSDLQLVPNPPPAAPHTEGDLSWVVTLEPGFNGQNPRTKKITMNYKLPARTRAIATSDQTIGLIGYKYHDF